MIKALQGFPDSVAAFACHGHVTRADYETVLIPDIEKRLLDHEKVRIYYETAADFAGVEPGAIWEDTKLGFTHFLRWERFAVVTEVEWIKQTLKFVGFLMPGEMRAFPTADAELARAWITEDPG